MSEKGYIRLSRKFFDNEYWRQDRTYSQAEAWLDLIQSARFEADPQMKLLSNGRRITVKRGEIHSSLRYLSNRWKWSVGKVKRFMDYHTKKGETEHRREQGETIIKLCKYDSYNPLKKPDGTQNGTPTEHRQVHPRYKTNKEKKEKNNTIVEIVDFLNRTIGAEYRTNTKATVDAIRARLNEGFELEDFKTVISKKAKQWMGTERQIYLRPQTLFSNKFESYLNEQIQMKPKIEKV